jgi:hypothetical protein
MLGVLRRVRVAEQDGAAFADEHVTHAVAVEGIAQLLGRGRKCEAGMDDDDRNAIFGGVNLCGFPHGGHEVIALCRRGLAR